MEHYLLVFEVKPQSLQPGGAPLLRHKTRQKGDFWGGKRTGGGLEELQLMNPCNSFSTNNYLDSAKRENTFYRNE